MEIEKEKKKGLAWWTLLPLTVGTMISLIWMLVSMMQFGDKLAQIGK